MLAEHFVLKDLPFYEVARLAYFEARQAHLEERERKHQDGTLRQVVVVGRLFSSFTAHHLTPKRKEPTTRPVQRAKTPPPTPPSSSSSPSFSSSSDEPKVEVDQVVPSIVCEEKEEEDENMTSNLRVRFHERQRKRLSESNVVNPTPSKKACSEPISVPTNDANVGAMPTRLSSFSLSGVKRASPCTKGCPNKWSGHALLKLK